MTQMGSSSKSYDNIIYSQMLAKQDPLISGTNIKTINGESILGSGNIEVTSEGISYDDTELRNSLNAVTERVDGFSSELEDKYVMPNNGIPSSDLDVSVQESLEKADTAIQNVKTINGNSIEGEGDVSVGSITSVDTGDILDDVNVRYATGQYVDDAIAQAIISTLNMEV